jgi:hypothetical protein
MEYFQACGGGSGGVRLPYAAGRRTVAIKFHYTSNFRAIRA